MNEKKNLPDDAALTALLRPARVSPDLPPGFQQNVWRRIEDSEAAVPTTSWLDAMAALILRPRFAAAAAAVLLLAGILAGTANGRQLARHEAEMNYVASVAPAFAR